MAGLLMKHILKTTPVFLALFLILAGPATADTEKMIPASPAASVPVTPVGTGYFDFRCNIEGASVYLDENILGQIKDGSLIVSAPVYNQPFKRLLRMEAPGYTVYNETILTSPKTGETMIVRGTLKILPFNLTGTLSLAITPPGSEVSIDNEFIGVVPESGIMTLHTVQSGNRNIRVVKAGYKEYAEKIYVEPNMIKKLRITLPPPVTGTFLITSNPPGAQVFINGTPLGITPLTVSDLNQGTYTIRYTLQGYQPSEQKIILAAGQTVPVTGILQPVPTPTPTLATPLQTPSPEPTRAGMSLGMVIAGLLASAVLINKK
jgi:hypothetical protein